ncbi:hypothetical protein [Methylobacterium cerastii]|uniref:hypothetical protein n=1 Tax=Methylobacterium cerastii TaxID=932741 RepID=UPI001EE30C80|nr:hypothetical protein [Methylobacterium cerastii]
MLLNVDRWKNCQAESNRPSRFDHLHRLWRNDRKLAEMTQVTSSTAASSPIKATAFTGAAIRRALELNQRQKRTIT